MNWELLEEKNTALDGRQSSLANAKIDKFLVSMKIAVKKTADKQMAYIWEKSNFFKYFQILNYFFDFNMVPLVLTLVKHFPYILISCSLLQQ